MITIASFQSIDEAQLARMKLEGSGIDSFIADEAMVNMNWLYSNAIGGVRLQIHEEDLETAKEILELKPAEKGVVSCPSCGSQNIVYRKIGIISAISLMIGFILPASKILIDCDDCKHSFQHNRS